MSENGTHFIVRHYIDGPSSLYFSMVCCLILIIIVVIILCFILGLLIYIAVVSKKSRRLSESQPLKKITKKRENHLVENLIQDSSSLNRVGTPVSTAQEFDDIADRNVESIPMSTFRRHTLNDRTVNISESSAELYDVLFPGKQTGELVYKPPKKLVTFAGQVYASGEGTSQTNLISAPSTSGLAHDHVNDSLEWDYYPQDNSLRSVRRESESERLAQQSTSISWV